MTTTDTTPSPHTTPSSDTARMTISAHIEAVAAEGQKFAAAARRGDIDAPVSACPGWQLRDLVRHLGEIHLWAAGNVALRPGSGLDIEDRSELAEQWPDLAVFWPEDGHLVDWYLQTNANLVETLRAAPADVPAPTFLPAPSPLAMWARRQAHETAIHRLDAEQAAGTSTAFDPAFAADGIDELLYGFYESVVRTAERQIPLEAPQTIRVHAHDTGDDWSMTISAGGIHAAPDATSADLVLTATASDLYMTLWNRGEGPTITATGDHRLLELWHEHTGVRWELD